MTSTPPEGDTPYPQASQPVMEGHEMPRTVALSIKLMWAKIALAGMSTILTFVMLESLAEQVLAESPGARLSQGQARAAVIVVALFFMAAITLFNLLAIYFVKHRANWARITYTSLAGVVVVLAITGIGERSGPSLAFSLVGAALSLASILFLWRSESNPWFATSRS